MSEAPHGLCLERRVVGADTERVQREALGETRDYSARLRPTAARTRDEVPLLALRAGERFGDGVTSWLRAQKLGRSWNKSA